MKTKSDPRKRVAEGLYRNTTSGLYSAHFRCGSRVIKQSLETTELAVAKRKLRDLRNEAEGLNTEKQDETVRQLAERHFKLQAHLSRSSQTKKRRMMESIRDRWPGGSDILVRRVRPSETEQWLNEATKGRRAATRNEWLFFLKGMFQRAVLDGVITLNPAVHLKPKKRDSVQRNTPSLAEFESIVAFIRENRNHRHVDSADFVEFLGLSGLGRGEAAKLTIGDVDLKRGQIRVRRLKTDTVFHIPIYPQLRDLVERLVQVSRGNPGANLLQVAEAKKSLDTACRALRFPDYTHISFRRMFITNAIERGVDVKTIAEWQGHRDGGKLILDTYSHVRRPHHDAMAQLMMKGGRE